MDGGDESPNGWALGPELDGATVVIGDCLSENERREKQEKKACASYQRLDSS